MLCGTCILSYARTHQCTRTNTRQWHHAATLCNTLQHAATHCNALQHTATHISGPRLPALGRTAHSTCSMIGGGGVRMAVAGRGALSKALKKPTGALTVYYHALTLQHTATRCNRLQHTATHCNTLQHTAAQWRVDGIARCIDTATRCNTLQHAAARCNTLQHTAAHCSTLHCSTLQHTATHCNTLAR